jgi:hypothetical protein
MIDQRKRYERAFILVMAHTGRTYEHPNCNWKGLSPRKLAKLTLFMRRHLQWHAALEIARMTRNAVRPIRPSPFEN